MMMAEDEEKKKKKGEEKKKKKKGEAEVGNYSVVRGKEKEIEREEKQKAG